MKTNLVKISMLALFMLFSIITEAQQGLNLSINVTPQNSWMINADDYDNSDFEYKALIMPAFGLGVGYNFTDNIGVGLELNYSLQGQRNDYLGVETTTRLDYLKIPILFHYNTSSQNNLVFVANVGPQLGILTNSKLLNSDKDELIDDLSEIYADITFGALFSFGIEYKITDKMNFFSLVKYDVDFTNAEDEDYSLYQEDRATTINSTLGLQLGLKFHF